MTRRRLSRSGWGGACIVLGLLSLAACGTDDHRVAVDAAQVRAAAIDSTGAESAAVDSLDPASGAVERLVADSIAAVEPRTGRPSLGCAAGATLGDGVHTRSWHDVDRQVIVRLPAATGAEPPAVIFNLHGSAASAASHEAYIDFSRPATERGYVVLIPEGMPPDEGGLQVWELFPGIYPDDPGYLASLADWIGNAMCVDLDRIFATGFSNGATMTNVIACHTGGRFSAIGPVGAHRFPIRCPSGPVSVLGIHGTDDIFVPYLGGPLLRRPEIWMPPVDETFRSWSEVGRCDVAPLHEILGDDIVRRRWTGCAPGVEVELYALDGWGHAWPSLTDPLYPGPIEATTVILDFFDRI